MTDALLILYVRDQQAARDFYREALGREPRLDVPGMTEFPITDSCGLGLMPEAGIRRLLPTLPDPAAGSGIPRAELYLRIDDPAAAVTRAVNAGGTLLDECRPRDWGDVVGYVMDSDGHVIAFANAIASGDV